MKNFSVKTLFVLFVFTTLSCQSFGAEADGTKVSVHVGNIGVEQGKASKPELAVELNGKEIYTTLKKYPDVKSSEFNADEDFSFIYAQGDELRVVLRGRSFGFKHEFLNRVSSTPHALDELFSGKLESAGAYAELNILFGEGKYKVTLKRSVVAPDDVEVCGGAVVDRDLEKEISDAAIDIIKAPEGTRWEKAKVLSTAIAKRRMNASAEKMDQRVRVIHNGRTVYDTWTENKRPQGTVCDWDDASFEIDWKKGDSITVLFLDADVARDDVIFSRSSNTASSIDMLRGTVFGGKSSRSAIFFESEFLKTGK